MNEGSKGVLVTGGAGSVGLAIAEAFAAQGDRVHVGDADPALVDALGAVGDEIGASVADVGSDADVARLHEEALAHVGRIDVLVNCVGLAGRRAAIEEQDANDWNALFNVNVTGFVRCIARVVPAMKERRHGTILNFSSGSTWTAPPLRSSYVASKAAIEGLTRSIARELGPFGVRCNAILPVPLENRRLAEIFERNARAHGNGVEEYRAEVLRYVSTR
ncbi:MAG: SDR family NAD(P)-dependent oxidoreductase, partial [Actinobacteria bacterium]|nr:SDR family NAD(P)-dependent oxidoreductase [Actinomycetota bacterium]